MGTPAASGTASRRHNVNEITCSFRVGGSIGRRGVGTLAWGTPMYQSIIFAIILYLTPSLLLVALLTCREGFSACDELAGGEERAYLFDEDLRPSRER